MKVENKVQLQEILSTLRDAIERDSSYFERVKNDKDLKSIRKEVDALLDEITKEAKDRTERAIIGIEEPLKNMEKWFNSEFCGNALNNEYRQVCENVADAKSKLKMQNYLEYLDAIQIIESTNNKLMHLKQAIKEDLTNSEKKLESIYEDIKRERNKANEEYSDDKIRFYLSIGSFLFGLWSIKGGWYSLVNFGSSISRDLGPPSHYDFPMVFVILILNLVGGLVGILLGIFALAGLILGIPYALASLYGIFKGSSSNNLEKFENETKVLKKRIAVAKQSI